jgi:predicted alpha/beta hydrolase family esterase
MKQNINEVKRMQELAGINEVAKNSYVVKDEDGYYIDTQKALDYLSQFDSDDIDAEQFINDDEGWGEYVQYLEDIESMTDEELEDSMRQEMSFYYFSDSDSI